VVGARAGAVEDLEAAVLFVGGGDDGALEDIGGELAGARAGDKESAGGDEGNGELVEVGIFAHAFFVFAAVDELGWIGEDEVPGASVIDHRADPGEGVGVGELDFRLVEVGVAFGHGDGVFVEIDGQHFGGTGEGGVDGEAAVVAAEVEHAAVLGEGAEFPAVVALVAEEPGFVAGGEIDLVADPVFEDFHGADGIRCHAAARGDAFDAGEFVIDGDDDAFGFEAFVEDGQPIGQPLPCAEGGDFDGKDIVELVGDEAGEEIGVAVDGAVGIGADEVAEGDAAEFGGLADGVEEKRFVEVGGGVAHDAQRHVGARVPDSPAEGFAIAVEDTDEVAGFGIARDLADHLRPDGRVEGGAFDVDTRHAANRAERGGDVDSFPLPAAGNSGSVAAS